MPAGRSGDSTPLRIERFTLQQTGENKQAREREYQ